MRIDIAETDEQIDACYEVARELRPHLVRDSFVRIVRTLQQDGYFVAYVENDGRVDAFAGFRQKRTLFCERFLYVDDMVTRSELRSSGVGSTLLKWLKERARQTGCTEVHLDSGMQREHAHRFYKNNGFEISGYHFRFSIESHVPWSSAIDAAQLVK